MTDLIPQETVEETKLSLQIAEFEFLQRKAALYASSKIIPKDFQGNVAHCYQVIEMARHLKVPEMIAFQHCYIIHGRASFSAVFMISCFNTCGRFTPINYEFAGEGDTRSCRATTTCKQTGEVVLGPEVSIQTAKDDGWYNKSGSKWKTIPELMLRYRAASWLVKTVAPEIAVGLSDTEEIRDGMSLEKEFTDDLPLKIEPNFITPSLTQAIKNVAPKLHEPEEETVVRDDDLF
jgi:hypothetical protein